MTVDGFLRDKLVSKLSADQQLYARFMTILNNAIGSPSLSMDNLLPAVGLSSIFAPREGNIWQNLGNFLQAHIGDKNIRASRYANFMFAGAIFTAVRPFERQEIETAVINIAKDSLHRFSVSDQIRMMAILDGM